MRKFALTAAIGAACLGLAACGGGESGNNATANTAEGGDAGGEATGGDGNAAGSASGGTAAAGGTGGGGGDWKGARIVEEGGKTYRVNADGTRVALPDGEWKIMTENGVRYRVDSGGTRIKINEQGIDIDGPDIDLPSDVDVGINKKGNFDIDVNDGDKIPEKKQ